MAFGSSVWHTNGYTMSIDVKNNGLEYVLKENQPVHQGLKIEVDLYAPMSTKEIFELKNSLAKQLKYFPLKIRFNEEVINTNPFEQKWTYETPQFWLKGKFIESTNYRDSSNIYNIGVWVNSFNAHSLIGFSGEIVSKPGHAFNLNISRDAVLTQQCELYSDLIRFLRSHSPKASAPKVRKATLTKKHRIEVLNSILLEQITSRNAPDGWSTLLSTPTPSEHGVDDIYNAKLIPLLDGNISIYQAFGRNQTVLVTDVENISREKERTLKETYPTYHFTELKWEFIERVLQKIEVARGSASHFKKLFVLVDTEKEIQEVKSKAYCAVFKGIQSLAGKSKGLICKPKDTPEAVQAALLFLYDSSSFSRAVAKLGLKDKVSSYGFKLSCGVASTPETSWLSGDTIVIDAKHAQGLLATGFPGFSALRNQILSHVIDYNSNRPDISDEFKLMLPRIERLITHDGLSHQQALTGFKKFVLKCLEKNVRPFSKALSNLEYFENLGNDENLFTEEVVERSGAGLTAGQTGDEEPPLIAKVA